MKTKLTQEEIVEIIEDFVNKQGGGYSGVLLHIENEDGVVLLHPEDEFTVSALVFHDDEFNLPKGAA